MERIFEGVEDAAIFHGSLDPIVESRPPRESRVALTADLSRPDRDLAHEQGSSVCTGREPEPTRPARHACEHKLAESPAPACCTTFVGTGMAIEETAEVSCVTRIVGPTREAGRTEVLDYERCMARGLDCAPRRLQMGPQRLQKPADPGVVGDLVGAQPSEFSP